MNLSRREVLKTALAAAAGTVFAGGSVLGDMVGDGFTVTCLGNRISNDCQGRKYAVREYYITHYSGLQSYMRLDEAILKHAPDIESYVKAEIDLQKEGMLMTIKRKGL